MIPTYTLQAVLWKWWLFMSLLDRDKKMKTYNGSNSNAKQPLLTFSIYSNYCLAANSPLTIFNTMWPYPDLRPILKMQKCLIWMSSLRLGEVCTFLHFPSLQPPPNLLLYSIKWVSRTQWRVFMWAPPHISLSLFKKQICYLRLHSLAFCTPQFQHLEEGGFIPPGNSLDTNWVSYIQSNLSLSIQIFWVKGSVLQNWFR